MNDTKGVLLIGGPADGEWHTIHNDRVAIQLVNCSPGPLPYDPGALSTEPNFEKFEYRSMIFRGERRDIEIFVIKKMAFDEAIGSLLRHYKPKDSSEIDKLKKENENLAFKCGSYFLEMLELRRIVNCLRSFLFPSRN